jgi:hypothetical protein
MDLGQANGVGNFHPSSLTNISKFAGLRSEDAYEWLGTIEDMGALCNWSDEATLRIAKVKLSGTAHQWSKGVGAGINTWDQFRTSFTDRFGEKYEVLLNKLHMIHQDEESD